MNGLLQDLRVTVQGLSRVRPWSLAVLAAGYWLIFVRDGEACRRRLAPVCSGVLSDYLSGRGCVHSERVETSLNH
jgi:hypothetical protein